MRMHAGRLFGFAAVVWTLGCGADSTPPKTVTGTVSANITDAPFPIDSVTRVDVWVVSLDATGRTDMDPSDLTTQRSRDPDRGWVTVAAPDRSFNLLELRNGVTASLGVDSILTGTYRQFRLVLNVDKSNVTLRDGKVLTRTSTPGIQWPSAGTSGVKVNLDGTFALTRAGAELLVDFNLEDSFKLVGPTISNGGLKFDPVIRAQKTK